jgi:hypothetical protein
MSRGAQIKKVSMSEIKSKLLRPALTSHYVCNFQPPNTGFINSRVNTNPTKLVDRLTLACSDASLPGSSLATVDIDNDFHGVSEKHAYRRLYDDRADFSFYVDSDEYYVIKFFESWIGYCVNENYGPDPSSRTYNYKVNYPDDYCTDTLSIIKFERDYQVGEDGNVLNKIQNKTDGRALQYNFVKAFPISIQSMPVSYEASQLLKCTVSFTYSRYWIQSLTSSNPKTKQNENASGIPDLAKSYGSNLDLGYNNLVGQGYNFSPDPTRIFETSNLLNSSQQFFFGN